MPHKLLSACHELSEHVAWAFLAMQTIATSLLLSLAPEERYAFLEWTTLTFLGASAGGVICFCYTNKPELTKILVGRTICAVLVGIIGSRVVILFHPVINELLSDPILAIGNGLINSFLGWLLVRPIFNRMQSRAEVIAHKVVRDLEERFVDKIASKVSAEAAVAAQPIAEKVEAVAKKLEATGQLPTQIDLNVHNS